MLSPNTRWYLSVSCLLLAFLAFLIVNLTPVIAILLALTAVAPPVMLLKLWGDTPTLAPAISHKAHRRKR